jgi:hypothetical protein
MKAGRFDELTLADKYWLIQEYAEYLLSIEHYDYRVSLYALNSHLVEVYKNIDTRIIDKISIAGSSELNKYLSRILIGNLKKPVKR